MSALYIIIGIIAVLAVTFIALVILQRAGVIGDRDGDLIPDAVEDTVKDVKEEVTKVKRRVKRVKTEISDVKNAVKEVGTQTGELKDAVKGKTRRGRRPSKKTTTKK